MNKGDISLTDILDVAVVLNTQFAYLTANSKESAGKEPLTEVVVIAQSAESLWWNSRDNTLKAFKVVGTVNLLTRLGVYGNEITKSELTADIIAQLLSKGLAGLDHETRTKLLRHTTHGLLRRLHEHRHRRYILTNQAA